MSEITLQDIADDVGIGLNDVCSAIREKISKRAAEKSLIEFTRQAWHIVEPQAEFRDNWHLHLVADYLENLYDDPSASDLVVNVPPGCMKSLLTCVMFPAWVWAKDPSKRFMGASYSEELSIRDAMKTRDIILSDWYKKNWPHVEIKKGDDQKIKFGLTSGGWRLSTSTGGRATGEHPDFKLVDDPHSAAQAQSDAERQRALEWFDGTLATRGVSRGARTIVIMQRLHEKDITGHILEDLGGYDHVCVPMRYVSGKRAHPDDPRTQEGELLWPELFPEDTVMILEKRLGEYGASGQLQQEPNPPGGGILKVSSFKLWPAGKDIPAFSYILQSYDTAFTEKTTGDPTACTVWGVFSHENRNCVMLLDAWAERLAYPKLREKVIKDWGAKYGGSSHDPLNRPRRPDLVLVEQKGSGQSILQDLRAANIPCRGYNPGRADKLSRAHQIAPILELGNAYIPESRVDKGGFSSWARPLIHQMEKFPNAEHDDLVDTASQALIYLRDANILQLDFSEVIDDPVEVDYYRRKKAENPYLV